MTLTITWLLLVFLSSLLPLATAVTTTPALPTSDVMFTASPPEISEGYTDHLELSCSFMHDPHSDPGVVMSIILSKMTGGGAYEEIAAVSSVTPTSVTVKNSLGASVSGQLLTNGQSNIIYRWQNPSNQVQGQYSCHVFSMDNIGHPKYITAEVEIGYKTVDINAILEKMREMQTNLQGQITDQKQQITDLTDQVVDLKTRLNNSLHMTFEDSAFFQGHGYFLSRQMTTVDVGSQQSDCSIYGGYLVEINDSEEFIFIKNFLNNVYNNAAGDYVMVGASDHKTEGKWKYLHSGGQVSYFEWYPGQPDQRGNEDCMALNADTTRQMHDIYCQSLVISRYLCEIPSVGITS